MVLPLYHINAECVTLIPTLLSGGSVVVAAAVCSEPVLGLDRTNIACTWSAMVPTIISELVDWDDPRAIAARRHCTHPLFPLLVGPARADLASSSFSTNSNCRSFRRWGRPKAGNIFSNPASARQRTRSGRPGLPWGFEARIVDREGADVPRGESGEVMLRGPGLMHGYYKERRGLPRYWTPRDGCTPETWPTRTKMDTSLSWAAPRN